MIFLVWILLFIIAAVLRLWVLFFALWFLGALLLLLRFGTRRVAHCLRVVRRLPERAFVGDTITLDLTIHNDSRLPLLYLELTEPAPSKLGGTVYREIVSLGPRQKERRHFDLVCHQRGYYCLDSISGQVGDPLGLDHLDLSWDHARRLIVYPRIVPLERLGLSTHSALVALPASARFQEDPVRVIGVRDYTASDPLRRIHWTASARTGRLVVKQLQPTIARETLICLDLDPEDYGVQWRQAIEQAIVVAASLANHIILREKLPVGMVTEAWDPLVQALVRSEVPPRGGRAQLVEILERLARFRPDRSACFASLLSDASVHLAWGSTMVIVSGEVDVRLAAVLPLLVQRGHALSIILVQPPHVAHPVAVPARVSVYRVWEDTDLGALA
jgi:uncharacterized protein (DUF58 family)